jgi:predicted O-methyltransferase YrrM
MKPEKTVNIKDKLSEIGIDLESLSLGEFDYIAEPCAKKMRDPGSELWKKVGAFFKPNLERGIFIYSLITKYKLTSYLEVGFGRGYSALCAAKAFADLGNDGQVMVIEPMVDDNHMRMIGQLFPPEWTNRIQVAKGKSEDVLPRMQDKYDIVYGDHMAPAVRADWEGVKDLWSAFCLFDDWHMEKGTDPMIQVHEALEEVEQPAGTKAELIIMDRRIFLDDRGWPDEKIKYGQLLLTNDAAVAEKATENVVGESWDW